ncbi:MAG TPA: Maf family protein [Myxococcales bacterium]
MKPKDRQTPERRTLILASSSPRRRVLLGQLGIELQVVPPEADESVLTGEAPAAFVIRVAGLKSLAVAGQHPGRVVLAADTAVVCRGTIFGKPSDERDAARMLRDLSGREHEVISGVSVVGPGFAEGFSVSTKVRFKPLTEQEIAWYVGTREPMDKAGAYAIQERGGAFVESIAGSYSNVVGLPLGESLAMLERAGLELPWRGAP